MIAAPESLHRASSGSQSDALDFLQEAELFDPGSLQEWKPDGYFEDNLVLPPPSSEHEKHSLPLDREEPDHKRQELIQDSGKKKPGRKPIMNEPTTKRKAQNRAAQRAFRERKENHVKDLETRVQELEQQNLTKSAENDYLKSEIARLRSGSIDNTFARSEDFTFAFASPVSMRHQSSGSMSTYSPSSENLPKSSDCPSLSSSHTSPQSIVEGDFNAAAMPFFGAPARKPSLPKSDTINSSGSFTRATGPSSLELQASQPQVSQLFSSPFSLSNDKTLSFDAMSYRDNGIFDNFDMDQTFFDTNNGFVDPLQLNAPNDLYLPMNNKSTSPPETTLDAKSQEPLLLLGTDGKPAVDCDVVWRKVTAHPKFPIFDLDELCMEFRQKATCKQNMQPSEKDWNKFDQELDEFAVRQEQKLLAQE